MDAKNYSLLAAAIFAVIAVVHLIRAITGWPILIDAWSVPIWGSWVACVVTSGLAWVGFAASRD